MSKKINNKFNAEVSPLLWKTSDSGNKQNYKSYINIRLIAIPVKVKNRIDELLNNVKGISELNHQKAYYLAYLMLNAQEEGYYADTDFYKPLSVKDYLKVGPPDGSFGERFYKQVFLKLAADMPDSNKSKEKKSTQKIDFEDAVFQSDGDYSKDRNKALLYRINPALISKRYCKIELDEISIDDNVNDIFREQISHFDSTSKNLWFDDIAFKANLDLELSIYTILLEKNVYTYVNNFDEMYRFVSYDVSKSYFQKVYVDGRLYNNLRDKVGINYGISAAQNKTQKSGITYSVIIDDDRMYIEPLENFEKRKQRAIKNILLRNIRKIKAGYVNRSISASNGRLHSSLTNINRFAIKYFRYGGPEGWFLGGLDLKTSQPCILANLISSEVFLESVMKAKHPKLKSYTETFSKIRKELAVDGIHLLITLVKQDLYLLLAEDYKNRNAEDYNNSLEGLRELAKKEVMRYLFASESFKSDLFCLNNVIPNLEESLKMIKSAFKEEYGDEKNHFNLFLQLVESYIFIELIYAELAKIDFPSFTKHDSVLFPRDMNEDNIETLENVIQKVKEQVDFKGVFKETKYLYINSKDTRFSGFKPFIEAPSLRNSNGEKSMYGQFN